jgi:hypothetical protein
LYHGTILALDIRHAQEKLWEVGRLFHPEGSPELASWVAGLEQLVYRGHVQTLLRRLDQELNRVSHRCARTKEKREKMHDVIA